MLVTYTLFSSSLQIHLVCANTETTNGHQILSSIQDLLGQLGLGTNTNDVDITDLFNQLITDKGFSIGLDLNRDKKIIKRDKVHCFTKEKNSKCLLLFFT